MARERFNKKLSPLVSDMLPDFVRSEYPTFVSFLEKYYEWMEQEGNPVERTGSLLSFRDVDESPDEFLAYLQNEHMSSFPTTFEANKSLIIKNISQFHKTKGTEQSFKFLFRVLYAIDIDVEIPWERVVRLSDAGWQLDTTIKVSTYFGNEWTKTAGYSITQAGSGATAIIDRIRQRWESGVWVTELYLHDIVGTFDHTGRITATFVEDAIIKTVYGDPLRRVVNGLTLVSAGTGYSTGDNLVFTGVCDGSGAAGYVSSIDGDGAILEVTLTEFGINYQTTPIVAIQSSTGTGGSVTASINAIATYPGYYADNEGGFLSAGYVLQDSDFYQKFSYVIETTVNDDDTYTTMTDYKRAVKETAHPAGMKLFGRVLIDESTDASQENATISTAVTSTVIAGISSSSSS